MSMCVHGWRSELESETGACPQCRDALLVKLAEAEATIARLEEELKVSRSQWENLSQSHDSYMKLWEKAESEKADVIATCEDMRQSHNASVKQMGGMADRFI